MPHTFHPRHLKSLHTIFKSNKYINSFYLLNTNKCTCNSFYLLNTNKYTCNSFYLLNNNKYTCNYFYLLNNKYTCTSFTCCYLVPQPSTSTVNHYTHLSLGLYTHLLSSKLIVDLVHYLYLSIVVTSSQSSQLQDKK